MRNFTLFLLKEGFELGKNHDTDKIYIEKCLDSVSIKQLTENMILAAENEFQTNIQKFQNKKFCSLLCDAGTVSKSHCLHFIIASLEKPVLKIFYESYDGDVFDSEFYFRCFSDVFAKIEENRINICSITSDSLRAQVRGLKTFFQTNEDPFIQILYRVPCFAHMINLVFKDLVKCSPLLSETINLVFAIVKLIRKPDAIKFIGTKCPTISKTRWLYIADILLFLLAKRDKINDYLQIQNGNKDLDPFLINDDIEFIYKLLILLKSFSLIVEKEDFNLFNIVPLTKEFFSELNSLYSCITKLEWKEMINIVDSSMRLRLMNNAYNETVTAYGLSSTGREELRKKYISIRTQNPYALSLTTPIETLSQERIKFEHFKTPMYTGEIPSDAISESFEEEEEDLEQEFENDIFKIEEDEEDLTNKIIELNETPFETRKQQEVYHNIYQITKTQLIQAGSLIDIPKDYIEDKYDTFLFEDPRKLQIIDYSVDPPYEFWKKAFCFNESWEMFAELALRYSCSFTSESIVERYLSIQKCIQGDKMTNISTPVVKARMQLHQSSK